MNGEEMAGLITKGLINGLLQGALILAPYFIGFCILCLLVRAVHGIKSPRHPHRHS